MITVKNAAKLMLPLLLLGGAAYGFNYLKSTKPNQPKPSPRERSWLVETVPAQRLTLSPQLTMYGSVESPTTVKAVKPSGWTTRLAENCENKPPRGCGRS